MKISLGAIFDEIPCTIVHGCWPNFGATLKIHKKSNLFEIRSISSSLIYNSYYYRNNITHYYYH